MLVGIAAQAIALDADVGAGRPPDGFSSGAIQQAREALSPAMCLLRYSVEITNPSSGEISRRGGYSLGLMVAPDGLVMAHGHLLLENRRPENIKVKIGDDDETEYDAVMLKKPDDLNVTFLRIKTEKPVEFPFVQFEEGSELELGEPVLLFGLLRESLDYARGLQLRRVGAILEEPRTTYCLDESVSFGYIGGPVVTAQGQVVGVLGFDLSASEGGEIYTRSGHPLIFQTSLFERYLATPPSEEAVQVSKENAWLGVFTQPLTDDLADYWDLPKKGGVVVSTVLTGSPADRAGLRMGDVIVDFNGTPVTAKRDQEVVAFTKLVRESPLNEPLTVAFLRDGEPTEIRLTLRPRPKSGRDAEEFEDEIFGLTVREITTDVRIVMNISDDVQGVLVRRVKSGSPAALAGIRRSYLIMSVGGRPTGTLEDYKRAVQAEADAKSDEITLFCRVGANTAFFRIQPRWDE